VITSENCLSKVNRSGLLEHQKRMSQKFETPSFLFNGLIVAAGRKKDAWIRDEK